MDNETKKILFWLGTGIIGYWIMYKYNKKSQEDVKKGHARFDRLQHGLQNHLAGLQQKQLQAHHSQQESAGNWMKHKNGVISALEKQNSELHQKLIGEMTKPPKVITQQVNVPYPVPQPQQSPPSPEPKLSNSPAGLVKRKLNL